MKTTISALLLGGFSLSIMAAPQAQNLTPKKGETMLPEEEDYELGFDADPFLNYVGNFLNNGGTGTNDGGAFTSGQSAIVSRMFRDAETAYRGRVRLGFGRSGNIYGDPYDSHSSAYGYLSAQVPVKVNDNLSFGLNADAYFFEDAPWNREGSDDTIFGLQLNSRYANTFGGVELDAKASVYHGGLASLNLGDMFEGVTYTDRTISSLDADLNYGGNNDWSYTSSFGGHVYNQSGMDFYDTRRYQFTQAVNRDIGGGRVWRNSAFFGGKDWDQINNYDSDIFGFSTGISGEFGCGAHYRVDLTFENRSYDYSGYGDQDVVGFDALVYKNTDAYDWTLFGNYGIQDRNITNKTQGLFADATGFRYGGTYTRPITNDIDGTFWVQGLHLNSEIGSRRGNNDATYYSTGVTVQKQVNPCAKIGVTASMHRIEYDIFGSSQSDTSANFNVFYTHEF